MAGWKGWEQQLLGRLGYKTTPSNLAFLRAWQGAEGGVASYNPLNTTWDLPGSGLLKGNTAKVRTYSTPEMGLAATVKTLRGNSGYAPILQGLAAGNLNPAELARRVASSPWGTKSFPSLGVKGSGMSSPLPGQVEGPTNVPPPSPLNFGSTHRYRDYAQQMAAAFSDPDPQARMAKVLGVQSALRSSREGTISFYDQVFNQQRGHTVPVTDGGGQIKPGRGGGTLAEAFYDPIGQWDNGSFSTKGIGGHSDHVHLSITNAAAMLAAIKQAQAMGLHVGENPYLGGTTGGHVKGSYHYRNFPGTYGGKTLGEGIDVSGSPASMAKYFNWSLSNLR